MQLGEMNDRLNWDVVEIGQKTETDILERKIDQLLVI